MSGERAVAALIGSPIGHSLSPVIHQAAFDTAGAPWTYVAFDVSLGCAGEALVAMRVLGIRGLSVTTPHKADVAERVDVRTTAAAAMQAVNTVSVDSSGRLTGHNTDGDGFVASLGHEGIDTRGRRVVVFGAGAAARSVIEALGRAGAADIAVVNRNPDRAESAASLAGVAHRVAGDDVGAVVRRSDVIVNATTVGFGGGDDPDGVPLDPDTLTSEHVVADLVYHPMETPLLRAARAAGAVAVDGLGMLVHQAALQQQIWLGTQPDVSVMRSAAEAELARRLLTSGS